MNNNQPISTDTSLPCRTTRATLEELRRTIKAMTPGAVEAISYGVPAFKYHNSS